MVLVDEIAAQRYWPNENPLGKQIRLLPGRFQTKASAPIRIVGIVGKMKSGSLDEPFTPHIYQSVWQSGVKILTVFVRIRRVRRF